MEVEGWLKIMDVFVPDPIRPATRKTSKEFLLSQPSLRWHQVLNVLETIFNDEIFIKILENNFAQAKKTFASSLKGELFEDIILVDAIKTLTDFDVFSWRFSPLLYDKQGEFDMVIAKEDDQDNFCDIFEIKKTGNSDWKQPQHLRYEPYLEYFRNNISPLRYKIVLYRGEEFMDFDDVMHLNAERFLSNISDYQNYINIKFLELKEKRAIYDKCMAGMFGRHFEKNNLFDYIEQYFSRSLPEYEMVFMDWLRKTGSEIPYPFEIDCGNPDSLQKEIFDIGLDWTETQKAINFYDKMPTIKNKEPFPAWLEKNYKEFINCVNENEDTNHHYHPIFK